MTVEDFERCAGPTVTRDVAMVGRAFWVFAHHLIAHPLMLVLPCAWGNAFHNWTAERAWPAVPSNSEDT